MIDHQISTSRDLSHVIGALEFGPAQLRSDAQIEATAAATPNTRPPQCRWVDDETLECAAQTLQPATSVAVCRTQVKMGPVCM